MRKKFFKKAVVAAMSVMMLGSALTVHAEDGVYTVKKGDNLSKIAKEVYGSREEWKTIYEANKGIIKDANTLYAGQQLVLPGKSTGGTTEIPTDTSAETTAEQSTAPMSAVSGRLRDIEIYWDYDVDKMDYVYTGSREGTVDVTISNTASFGNPEYWVPIVPLPAAPAGYEWKEVDLLYVSDTLDSPSSYYYTTGLDIEGLDQIVTSNKKPDNWTYTEDEHIEYETYDFEFNYNGTTYTECKFYERCIKEISEDGVLAMQVMLLLPKEYDGSVVYTAYGAGIADQNIVRYPEEAVSFVIQ